MDVRVNSVSVQKKRLNYSNKNNTALGNRSSQKSLKSNVSFGMAPTTAEANRIAQLIKQAQPHLGKGRDLTKVLSGIFFQASMPAQAGKNPGIGTIYSKPARQLLKTIAKVTGMNDVLVGPDGSYGDKCPYDGSPFTLNPKAIDLEQLEEEKFGGILKPDSPELQKLYGENPNQDKWGKVAFNHVNKNFEPALRKAHQNFQQLDESHPLKQEYRAFSQKTGIDAEEIDRQAVQFALSKVHGNDNWQSWGDLDRELFGDKENTPEAAGRIAQVKSERKDDVDFFKWSQFIVRKQHDETVADLEKDGISMTGDCLVGFSQKIDGWTHKADLEQGKFGGIPEAAWGFPLPKEGQRGDNLIARKFESYLGRYKNVRIDATRYLVETCVYSETEDGKPKNYQMRWNGDKHLRKFIEIGKRLHGATWNMAKNVFENLGSSKDHSVSETKRILGEIRQQGTPMPQINISSWMEWGLWRKGDDVIGKYPEQEPKVVGHADNFVAVGTHDDKSGLEIVKGDPKALDRRWVTMLGHFDKQSIWGMDMFGKGERYNDYTKKPGEPESNWEEKLPTHAEEFYFTQVKNGFGFNGPALFRDALRDGHPDGPHRNAEKHSPEVMQLADALDSYAKILQADGPMTIEESDKQFGKDTIRGK